jgi:hypothetical protein
MPLLGNYSVLNKTPGRQLGGGTVPGSRANWNNAGSSRNAMTNASWSQYSAKPVGYGPGTAWTWQQKAGQIGLINAAIMGVSLSIVLGTPTSISSAMTMSSTMNVVSYGAGNIECNITPFTDLTPGAIAAAVWNSDKIGFADPGTFGEMLGTDLDAYLASIDARLPAALSGGKMDSSLDSTQRDAIGSALLALADGIETGYTLKQTLRLISAVLLGKVTGAPGSPVFRNMPDTADRVAATADTSGNRSAITLTP